MTTTTIADRVYAQADPYQAAGIWAVKREVKDGLVTISFEDASWLVFRMRFEPLRRIAELEAAGLLNRVNYGAMSPLEQLKFNSKRGTKP